MTTLFSTLALAASLLASPVDDPAHTPVDPIPAAQEAPAPEPKDVDTATSGEVTITSRGSDVRNVLFDLFSQANKSFVLDPNIKFELFLALKGVDFDEALAIICQVSGLQFELQNGIYFINRKPATPATPVANPAPQNPRPPLRLTEQDLAKKVTVKLEKADLRVVFRTFSQQTMFIIDVDQSVPAYKIDAFLVNVSLKDALTTICDAANLEYVLTDQRTILIRQKRTTPGPRSN